MTSAVRWCLLPMLIAAAASSPCRGQGHGGSSGHHGGGHPQGGHVGGPAFGGGMNFGRGAGGYGSSPGYGYGSGYGLGYGYAVGPGFGYYGPTGFGFPAYSLPIGPTTTGPSFGFLGALGGGANGPGGLRLPAPPAGALAPAKAAVRRPNPARGKEQLDVGDRSFRAGNFRRAEERYQAAAKADPTSPLPHLHLSQVSISRGNFAAAANHLRDMVAKLDNPGWLLNPPDIQALYAEPGDFARQIAKIESHLQAHPNDRDAAFVLGAELYLSGRSRQAADAFQRLTDRRPDEALAAFLDASKPAPAAAAAPPAAN